MKKELVKAGIDARINFPESQFKLIPASPAGGSEGLSDSLLEIIDKEAKSAISRGFSGLRVSLELSLPEKQAMSHFGFHMQALREFLAKKPVTLLCTCPLDAFSASEAFDLMGRADIIIKKEGKWTGLPQFLAEMHGRVRKDPENILGEMGAIPPCSPLITFVLENKKGFPLKLISENISRFGYRAEDFSSGKLLYTDILHPADLKDYTAAHSLKEEFPYFEKEYRLLTNKGETRWVKEISWANPGVCGNDHYQGIIIDISENKHLFDTLQKSEQKFRSIFDNSAEAISIYDLEGRILEVNRAACECRGYSRAELLGKKLQGLQNSMCGLKAEYGNGPFRKAKNRPVEVECRSRTGLVKFREVNSCLIEYEGKPALLSIGRDISEKKKAEGALRASEQKYSTLVEKGNDGVIIVRALEIKFLNQKMLDMTGYSAEETLGKSFLEFVVDNYREALLERNSKLMENNSEELRKFELEILTKDGSRIPVELNSSHIEYEGKAAVMAFVRDITDRKAIEKIQYEQIHFLENLLDAIPAPVYYKNKDEVYIGCNRAFEKFTGMNKEAILGKKFSFFVSPEMNRQYSQELELIKRKGALVYEAPVWYSDGRVHHVSFHKVMLGGITEKDSILLGVMWDITDRTELEESLRKAKMEAEATSRAKTEFIANMSHELRTPLNSVIGFSGLLLENIYGNLNNKQLRQISNILKNGEHLLEMVNNLLDISRIEAEKIRLEYEEIPFHIFVEEIKEAMDPLASKKNIILEYRPETILSSLRADRQKFRQILVNLLTNALKFTPEGGLVTIETSHWGKMVEVRVTDTGPGIAKADRERIFEPFVQADSSVSREFGGAGLGLALVRRFVKLHGGEIRVESEPGKGSSFIFTLPLGPE